jgi:hypothetical protein
LTSSPTASSPTSTSDVDDVRLGSQTPRVRNVPPYVKTYGNEVVDFMAQIGRPLDPWQAAITLDAFGVRSDGLWSAFELLILLSRQNGKGGCTEAIELGGLFLFREPLILHSAHQFKTSTAAFRRLQDIIDGSDWLTRRVKMISRSKGDESIELTRAAGGGRLQFVARTLGSGRGLTGSKNVFDEAYALTVGQYAAQTPTLSTIPNPQIIYTSTPPDEDTGPMPQDAMLPSVRKRGLAAGKRIAMYEWSPEKPFDRTDRNVWYDCNPSLGIRISEWFLAQQLDAFTGAGRPEKFDTEHLGVWIEKEDRGWEVFREPDWALAQDPATEIVGSPAFCVELSRDLSTISIGAAGRNADGKRHLELAARFPADAGRLVGWLKKRREKWRPVAVAIDPGGPANAFISDVEKHYGEIYKPIGRDVAAACGSVYVGISAAEENARDVRIRPHPVLDAAARGAIWRDRGEARVFDRRNDDAPDVAPIMAVTLADLALATAPAPEQTFFGSWR